MSEFLGFGASLLIFFLYFLGTLGVAVCVMLVINKFSEKQEENTLPADAST